MNTTTPRTDAKAYTCDCPDIQEDAVPADLCRQLERELTTMTEVTKQAVMERDDNKST